ncbi:FHA domain-containing protein [Polyangium sp. y55x31]|uniref:FHA domain-containing protein n=1 Tax=Polyangium sp. y55x31 TaxID=3042688 RepID=UPI002482BA75|nr:FHA domain-containing protein [Polyangium sp. y55x31]MDI1475653.1 FHA domain-containing protein [Polyangium sp. y55x31]
MNEQQAALRINSASNTEAVSQAQKEHRSGVFAKGRRDGSGWGLVLVGFNGELSPITLTDGAVIGSASRDAHVEGAGIAPEHAKVSVRADGCYVEDLGTPDGTFVDGVRARRIGLSHGDVVRLGSRIGVFVERDLSAYGGTIMRTGPLVHGPRQRKDWIDPILDLVKSGSCVCIEGGPGTGKRTMAKLAAAVREGVGDIVTVDGRAEGKPTIPAGIRPMTWVVLDADRLPRPQQLEIAHAVGRTSGVSVIATVGQPLDRAVGDGKLAPWFASLFSGKRVTITPLEHRREDIAAIVQDIAERRGIELSRITPELLESLVRAGWPGGVPQLEATLVSAAEVAGADGAILPSSIASSLARASRTKPSLPPATDPSLARARLEDALARANGSVASAARSLGMSRQAIYREAERLGLDIARRKFSRS